MTKLEDRRGAIAIKLDLPSGGMGPYPDHRGRRCDWNPVGLGFGHHQASL